MENSNHPENTEIISCPFYDDTPKEQFYGESVIDKIKKMFPNKNKHMQTLIKLYKFIFRKEEKTFINKTEEELLSEIMDASLSLEKLQTDSNFLNQYKKNNLFEEKIKRIPVFIDFAYLYYIQHIDSEAPIHKLPMTQLKYKLIMNALHIPKNDLYACFEQCIDNKFIADLRIEVPPFYLRTDMPEKEIKEKIKLIVEPLFKDILKYLLDIHKKYYTEKQADEKQAEQAEPAEQADEKQTEQAEQAETADEKQATCIN